MSKWIGIALLAFLIAYSIGGFFIELKKRRAALDQLDKTEAAEPEFIPATVVALRAEIQYRHRSHVRVFTATFSTAGGKRTFCLPEQKYLTLNEGDRGTLVLLNGEFCDFGEGDDQ